MLPTIQIGPIALQVPGLIIIAGIWLGLSLAERISNNFRKNQNKYYNLVIIIFISSTIGARLTYVIRFLAIFKEHPVNVLSLNPGLLDPFGGAATGLIAGLIYGDRQKLSFWATLDAFTPLFAVMMTAIPISQWASGDAYGIETNLPWGINLWGAKRHPIQIYKILAGLFIFTVIAFRAHHKMLRTAGNGTNFLRFSAMAAGSYLFLNAFQGEAELILDRYNASQIVAWLVLAFCLIGLYILTSTRDELEGDYEK
jgi:prolipoprotein diacylglyceryltransferase